MVEVVFTFDVPKEKQAEYLKATIDTIIPYWESHGCQSYDIWQATEGKSAFVKRMLFPDMPTMQKAMSLVESDDEAKSIVGIFRSFVPNPTRRIYVKKT